MKKPVRQLKEFIRRRLQAGKSAREVFSEVYRSKAWGDRGNFFSGFGSHIQPAIDAYATALAPLLSINTSVVDLGCGDFNMGMHIRPLCGYYIACDVVPELIEHNRIRFADLSVDFRCLDITTDPLPGGDVALVRQVLQHLNNDQIARFISKVGAYNILVVTEHVPSGRFKPNVDKATGGGIRVHGVELSGVDLAEPPFSLSHRSSKILAEVPDGKDLIRTTAYFLN
jgi:SAM-dependent methyltransferase